MNNEYVKLELRICLIGEDFVGKKSIISRFHTIKATETIESNIAEDAITTSSKNSENIKIKFQDTSRSKEKEKIFKPCHLKEKKQIIPKMKTKLQNLTNFTKVFQIYKNYLEIKFFLIPPAERIAFSDNLADDDEVEKLHKIRFTNIKTAFSNIISKKPDNDLDVQYLLMFVFDITNNESLEKIRVYYEEINKHVHFEKSYFRILVGNKIDLKFPYEAINRDLLDSFIASKNLSYYETSAKLYFDFPEFFERMFFDCLVSTYPPFDEPIFRTRMKNLLSCNATIPKDLRYKTLANEDIPGPDRYNTNVYDMAVEKGKLAIIKLIV